MRNGWKTRLAATLAGLLCLLGQADTARACASCGCGAGGYYLGLMPMYARNYVGLRYRTAAFATHDLTAPAGYENLFRTREVFQTAEVVARIYLHPRVQVLAFLPYQIHTQRAADGLHQTSGLGDAIGVVSYNLFNNLRDTTGPALRHSLWLGMGVKAGTGRYTPANTGERSVANAGFMLGTGSWDPMALLSYTLRRARTGLSLDVSGRYAMRNSDGYTFGNRLTATLSAYTIRQRVGWGYMPSLGLYAESSGRDRHSGYFVAQTGGSMLAAQAGMDVLVQRWTVGALAQLPVAQYLADGSQHAEPRLMVQVGCAF